MTVIRNLDPGVTKSTLPSPIPNIAEFKRHLFIMDSFKIHLLVGDQIQTDVNHSGKVVF